MTRGSSRHYPQEFTVTPADVDQPVERFVRRCLDADPAHVSKLLRQGRVRYRVGDGTQAEVVLSRGDRIAGPGQIQLTAREGERAPPAPNRRIRLRLVYEDEELVVVDKPSGLATHPGPRHGSDTLLNAIIARYPECAGLGREQNHGLVHRLDLETSGLLVVARSGAAHQALLEQFRAREVEKRYLALVHAGGAKPVPCMIDEPIEEREARTEIESVESAGSIALLGLRLHTGRTHQIRIHLAGRGMPVLRDVRHGTGADELTARLYVKRMALHAERLSFARPATGERLAFHRPLPRDLRHSWKRAIRLFTSS